MSHVNLVSYSRLKRSGVRDNPCWLIRTCQNLFLLLPEAEAQVSVIVKHIGDLDLPDKVAP